MIDETAAKFPSLLQSAEDERRAARNIVAHAARPQYRFESEEHVHTLDGKPLIGTSTAVGVIGKPLTWWASGMALAPLGWLNPKKAKVNERMKSASAALDEIRNLPAKEYEAKLQECYRAHNTKKETTAVAGTDMHAGLERYVKECIYLHAGCPILSESDWDFGPEVLRFHEWACEHVAQFLFSEGHCYSERLWTGGICDFGAELVNRNLALGDFKSSREAYFTHFVQAGGYAAQIAENGVITPDGVRIVAPFNAEELIVLPFGSDAPPQSVSSVGDYRNAFESAVLLHKLQQRFNNQS